MEAKAVEVGNIFSLGTKYSSVLDLNYVDEKGEKKSEATEEQSATKSNDAQKTEQTASPAPEKTSLGNNNRVPSTPIPDKEKKRIAEGISGMLIAEGHALEALKKTAKQEEITPENTNTGRPSGPPSL